MYLIFLIVLAIITAIFCIKKYKKSSNGLEKGLWVFLLFYFLSPIIIYYLDYFNFPSKLGLMKNINSETWVNILSESSINIIIALINSLFLLFVTDKQIKSNREENIETKRLENLPLIKYNVSNELLDNNILGRIYLNINREENGETLGFNITMENIGLNSIRKVFVEINSIQFSKSTFAEFSNPSSIKVNDKISTDFNTLIPVKLGDYDITVNVYYQDLLKNWYKQRLDLSLSLGNILSSKNYNRTQVENVKIFDEELIKKDLLPKGILNILNS